MKKAFTLIEVLVSFAIMASLLTLILQSQGEIAYFSVKNKRSEEVRREIEAQILAYEREDTNVLWSTDKGTFNRDHALAGFQYERTKKGEKLLGVFPITNVSFLITWEENKIKQSYESSIIMEQ
ncbi:MAG: type II secretion system protein [SAR324 cluster bacterium]|nr:type II secretion system protein [SAR324 cluster bacterium]